MHIADMHLYYGSRYCPNSILQSYGRMRIGSCIEYDSVTVKSYFMDFIDHLPFNIALIVIKSNIGIHPAQIFQIRFKRDRSVYTRLTFAQQIYIRTVNDLYSHLFIYLCFYISTQR